MFCVAESCSCSSDHKCSYLSPKCECPCTSPLQFNYCLSQFPNSRFVQSILLICDRCERGDCGCDCDCDYVRGRDKDRIRDRDTNRNRDLDPIEFVIKKMIVIFML